MSNSNKKVFLGGARFIGGQIDRLDAHFINLGFELTENPSEADLVYINNPWFDDIIRLKDEGKIKGKVIFNILDMAPHLGDEFPQEKLRHQITYAHAVTCISHTVKENIKSRLGIEPTVIYNPVKPVSLENKGESRIIRALFVGRVNDAEKRAGIGAKALSIRGFQPDDVVTVGGERPFYGGRWSGPVDDVTLNKIYNRSDYLICPTRNAFLGLPILEAMATGCIPIITDDLDIRQEFIPSSEFPEYDEVKANEWSIANFILKMDTNTEEKENFRKRIINYYNSNIKWRVDPYQVALRINIIYNNLISHIK